MTTIQQPNRASAFKERLRESMQEARLHFTTIRVSKHENVYVFGDQAEMVYFIESGQIKLLTLSLHGKACLLGIHTAGDMFGELYLAGSSLRHETATAMKDTTLRQIPCDAFFSHLCRYSLVEGFVQYLAGCIAEQQQIISHLLTADSEYRLGETLLLLARKIGLSDPRSKRIQHKITHEELSQMVGTTRPRITKFMLKFRSLGLIEMTPEHFLIIKEKKLSEYLTQID
jgi:CRP/FNR family cyclic AMP-dependent transcriptional regulator